MVNDERVANNERQVPMLAAGYSQPLVVDNTNYHCTAHSAVTPVLLQVFKMMNPKYQNELIIPDPDESGVPNDLFGQAIGHGYATPASILGFNGNGGFKSAMKLEKRDMLVAAAQDSNVHTYADAFIELYEAEAPATAEERVRKEVRRNYQDNLWTLWSDKFQAYHYSIAGGINGMDMYYKKFRFMSVDPEKVFRFALADAMKTDPRNRDHPSVMKNDSQSQKQIEQITRLSLSDTFFVDSPRTEVESQSFGERERLRLAYPPDRAPVQYQLQRKTSEMTLTVPSQVQSLTPLQLKAEKIQSIRGQPKQAHEKRFTILDEAQVNL